VQFGGPLAGPASPERTGATESSKGSISWASGVLAAEMSKASGRPRRLDRMWIFEIYLRHASESTAVAKISIYIDTELSRRVAGGLGWGHWAQNHLDYSRPRQGRAAQLLAYPLASLMALFWAFNLKFVDEGRPPFQAAGYVGLWCIGVISAVHLTVEILRGQHQRTLRRWTHSRSPLAANPDSVP